MATPWIGAIVVLGALALTTLAGWLDRPSGIELGVVTEDAVLVKRDPAF
jgi:MFS transporter, DHA1 family, inner membrane transport protein